MNAISWSTRLGWRWARVNGSSVAHLCPPAPLRLSRTACNRLPVFDATIEVPAGLLEDVRRCLACSAYGRVPA